VVEGTKNKNLEQREEQRRRKRKEKGMKEDRREK
jgi:hypothetical protein